MLLLDGRVVAQQQKDKVKLRAQSYEKAHGKSAGLAVVLIGDDGASQVYVRNKEVACQEVGIKSFRYNLEKNVDPQIVMELIQKLNHDNKVQGILVQMPVPKQIKYDQLLEAISPFKDVDGLTYENMGYAWAGRSRVNSCTPSGVMEILRYYKIPIEGRHAVIIGRSNIVGKPMAQLLLDANATVTICHSKSQQLNSFSKQADILIVAAGRPHFICKEDIKKGAVVIDVGIHRQSNGKLCGDVNPKGLENWVHGITPVPGGVGPMTIAMLLRNTMDLADLNLTN